MSDFKVVGIDPGLAGTGIGIIEGDKTDVTGYSFGSIETEKSWPLPDRLEVIYRKVSELIQNQSPDMVVLEDIFILNSTNEDSSQIEGFSHFHLPS